MEKGKILIAGGAEICNAIKSQIDMSNFEIIDWACSANETIRKANILFPDIIITDYLLSDMTGLDLAQNIESLKLCPVIILSTFAQSEYAADLKSSSLDIFCLLKPTNKTSLNHMLSLVIKISSAIEDYQYQIQNLKKQLDDRKIIEKAKGILMKKFNLSEDAAYKQMRSKAMNASRSLVEIARSIIEMFQFFEG
ncbi:MAG: ANTAR domain-containing protein [Elusimicrobiota bacterium]|nr:ANTAR domain-containing protein [Elusimicrobiota bacterium]